MSRGRAPTAIVAAVRLGRRIFDNIKKAIVFILAVHVPIAGLVVAFVVIILVNRSWTRSDQGIKPASITGLAVISCSA